MQRVRCPHRKEFLELRQNPRLFGLVIVAPILQLTLLGYAATTDVQNVPVVVADGDRSPESRTLIARFDASPSTSPSSTSSRPSQRGRSVPRTRPAWIALAIPARLRRPSIGDGRSRVQVLADGTDSNSTSVALGYATALVGEYAQELMARSAGARRPPPASAHRRQDARLVQPAAREPRSS